MLLARAILQHAPATDSRRTSSLPRSSHFIGSDVFFTYIIANGWWGDLVAQKVPGAYFTAGAELPQTAGAGRFPAVDGSATNPSAGVPASHDHRPVEFPPRRQLGNTLARQVRTWCCVDRAPPTIDSAPFWTPFVPSTPLP